MITKATSKHIPIILKSVGEFKKISRREVENILASPNEIVWVDEEREMVCRITTDPSESQVVWLVPHTDIYALFNLMSAALIDLYNKFPSRRDNRIWARFKDRRGCLSILMNTKAKEIVSAWDKLFPSSHTKYKWWDGSYIIWSSLTEVIKDIKNMVTSNYGNQKVYRQ